MRSTNHPNDWERQRERLSAYLDGELGADERRALERHLPGCPECRAELAAMGRMRALLHALPTPRPPRSFALPEAGTPIGPTPRAPSSRRPAAAAAPTRLGWYRASQWAGGVAASLGLFLLLGSAILGILAPHEAASSRFGAAAPSGDTRHTPATASGTAGPGGPFVNPSSTTTPSSDKAAPTTSATPTASATPTPASASDGETGSGPEGPPLLPLAGTGLLVGGVALLVAGRAARRRRAGE